jgi:hypothetical protein
MKAQHLETLKVVAWDFLPIYLVANLVLESAREFAMVVEALAEGKVLLWPQRFEFQHPKR